MRSLLIALSAFWVSLAQAAPPPSFAITCNHLVVGLAKTTYEPIRIDWDGIKLVNTDRNLQDRISKSEERVVSSKNLETGRLGGAHFTFHTGTHPTKAYRYHTALKLLPLDSGYSLERMFATTDSEGFFISASSIEYRECQLQTSQ